MSLAAMQRALTELLRSPDSIAADSERSAFAEGLASASDRLTPAMQLDIYREQFFLRHLDVLHEDFRSLAHRLGDGAFETLAKAYLKAFPPRSFTLRDLGAELPGFVASTAPWNGDTLLADLARVEWAFVEAFDAASEPALDSAAVASVPEEAWPSARLVLQPSVQRVALRHAAHDYRHAIRNGEPVAGPPEARASFVVVFRGRSALEHVDSRPRPTRCWASSRAERRSVRPASVWPRRPARRRRPSRRRSERGSSSGPRSASSAASSSGADYFAPASALPNVFGWKLNG